MRTCALLMGAVVLIGPLGGTAHADLLPLDISFTADFDEDYASSFDLIDPDEQSGSIYVSRGGDVTSRSSDSFVSGAFEVGDGFGFNATSSIFGIGASGIGINFEILISNSYNFDSWVRVTLGIELRNYVEAIDYSSAFFPTYQAFSSSEITVDVDGVEAYRTEIVSDPINGDQNTAADAIPGTSGAPQTHDIFSTLTFDLGPGGGGGKFLDLNFRSHSYDLDGGDAFMTASGDVKILELIDLGSSPTGPVAVSEPGTLALLGIGLAALGLSRRRRHI